MDLAACFPFSEFSRRAGSPIILARRDLSASCLPQTLPETPRFNLTWTKEKEKEKTRYFALKEPMAFLSTYYTLSGIVIILYVV